MHMGMVFMQVTAKDFSRFQESYATILKVIFRAAPLDLLGQDLTCAIIHQYNNTCFCMRREQ